MNNMIKFNHRQNEEIILPDGRKIYLSRSVAVVGVIFAIVDSEIYILTEKRSSIMDEPNKQAVVSGYLDWDEDTIEAIRREIYEETSFLIDDYENELIFNNNSQPFYINSHPKKDAKQNVTLSYMFVYEFDKLPKEVEKHHDKEIDSVKWISIREVDNYKWAFNHDERIKMAWDYFVKHY